MTVLSGKGALVTGGSRGIGRAVVERLTADGAEVVFSYRQDAAAAETGPALIADVTPELYERMFAVNTRAVFLTVQWAGRVMRDGGRIINVSTLNTEVPAPAIALYAATKAAVEQFAKVAARELGGRGITANNVLPGATDTDMLRAANPPEALERAPEFTALRRLGTPGDVAAVVAFLAGPDGRWITGQSIRATGGMML
ncbi:SDR family oxidoreductase [Nonomuraea sp. MCN248]|uniref:SDR family oxidoreductase n=1 Tax=Nonomuraea corallina TaxID=2989783 RepID=A0ABT4SEW9_9ACTN|nr:SDR family oxidoreductase [Nonomuraea corallina]MDA0635732.1 SDR family oxidoreductase [Nonomuraea corallina]